MQLFSRRLLASIALGLALPLGAASQTNTAQSNSAQSGPAPGDPDALTPIRALRAFTRDSGSRELPQSTVTAVHEDREGVVWVLTLDGIAHIEHAAIERLPGSPDAPLTGPYYAVVDRRAGGIHVVGDDSVATWNESSWSRMPTPVTFTSIAEDTNGRLISVDRLGSVWEYASDRRWAKVTRQNDAANVAVVSTPDGTVYVGGPTGVRELRETIGAPIGSISSPVIVLHATRAGEIWCATEDGRLQFLSPGATRWTLRPVDGWDGGVIHAIGEDAQGRIWIGGERGRVAFGTAKTTFRIWTPVNGVTPATVNTIAGDRTGSVWFGFNGYGLQQWLGDAWSHRPFWIDPREADTAVTLSVRPTPTGFLAAVSNHGIWRWNGRTLETFGAEHGLSEDVRVAVEPEPGVIWAGTRRGLFESRGGGPFRRVFSLSVNAGYVNGLFKSPDGIWWAATEQAGIFIQDNAGWRPHLRINAVLPDVNVRQITWRTNGDIWIATARGVAAYRGASLDRVTVPQPPPAIASPYALLEHDGAMWVGGGAGLAMLVNGEWQAPAGDMLPGARISSLAAGSDGSVWIGGSEGIARVKDGRWTRYDATSGLLSEEINPQGLTVLPSGDVFAGTMSGLAHFSASMPEPVAVPLRVYWRRDAAGLAAGALTLPPEARGVALQWSAPWPRPVALEYRTRIPRLSDRWSTPLTASELRVENLAAGDWNVEVAARLPGTGDAGWSEPLRAQITVLPFWYETLSARMAGLVFVGLAVTGMVRWRTGRLRRKAKQLERAVARELARVKILRGLLPICSFCKKIRDDGGYWNQLEQYIAENSQADFSHGLCPDCLKSEYPELMGRDVAGGGKDSAYGS